MNVSGVWSTIFCTLLMPEASTTMSTPPKRFTAASTILSQFAAELGRLLTVSTLAPSFSQSAATFFSASAPPAASTTLQPAPAQHLRRERAERAGRAGDDRGLAFDVEQRERVFQEVFGHDYSPFSVLVLP